MNYCGVTADMKDLKPDRLNYGDTFCDMSTNKCYIWNDVCDCWVDIGTGKEVTYTSTIRGMWDDLPIDVMSIEKGTKYVCVDTGDVFILEDGGWVNENKPNVSCDTVGLNMKDKHFNFEREAALLERALDVATENFENFETKYGDYH